MKLTGTWIDAPATQAVCHALTSAGFQALFVGGCVRNALMGVPVSDIDIATDARPDTVAELQSAAGFKVIPTGIDHGTLTVIASGVAHEITTFRHDVETDGRRAVVAFSDNVRDDALRRDFTMNALYADASGKLLDPLDGIADLRARRVRFIDNPADRIREDYLRILRFFRFHAWYGDPSNGLSSDGLAAIADNLDGLEQLSRERVGSEMTKLLAAPDPAPAVAAMRSTGVLARILPGADDRALAPLVHLETGTKTKPDSLRRLAVLGGSDTPERLRMSKKDAGKLAVLRSGIENSDSPTRLGYLNGATVAEDILLLRAAIFESPLDHAAIATAHNAAKAQFPINAADLMPERSGPALGKRLKQLEAAWIDSNFSLTKPELLALPEEPDQ
ncbi:CCA tRNA nucleotidyltransferase [Rhodobacteraceae bacterium D3-12]|nr:CCA tRNA nucleotidyltransferase [Rhodobacteraceae bacterium D3-12]